MNFNWNGFYTIWCGGLFLANLYLGNDLVAFIMLLVCAVCFGLRDGGER